MTTAFNIDASEANWGAYATCNISATTGYCQPNHHPTQVLYVGQNNRIGARPYVMAANLRMKNASNGVQIGISVFDDGSGNCANPMSNLAGNTFTVGTTWNPVYLPVNFAT